MDQQPEIDKYRGLPEHFYIQAIKVLGDLGFNTAELEKLKGKRILDIGAGEADAAQLLRTYGVNVIPLDKNHPAQGNVEGFVVADANEPMQFEDGEFDIVMTHAALYPEKDMKAIKEAFRVAKEEVRIGPFFVNKKRKAAHDAHDAMKVLQKEFDNVELHGPFGWHTENTEMYYITIHKNGAQA